MLIYAYIALTLFILMTRKAFKQRAALFIESVCISLFFFSSSDPIIGIPFFFYAMMVSIIVTLRLQGRCLVLRNKTVLLLCSVLLLALLVRMVLLSSGFEHGEYFLINKSNTDVATNVSSQLLNPTLDFNVIKHVCFFVLFLLFVIANFDILSCETVLRDLSKWIKRGFLVLNTCVILEFLFINLTGINDRFVMAELFNIAVLNQKEIWTTFGFKSVAFWFTERSEYACIFVLYGILLYQKRYSSFDIYLFITSILCSFCTGSTTAIVMTFVMVLPIVAKWISGLNAKARKYAFAMLLLAYLVVMLALIRLNILGDLFRKLSYFMTGSGVGSGFYRRRSNEIALSAFMTHPLFGVGAGTVLSHGLTLQTLANVGLIGMFGTLALIHNIMRVATNTRILFYVTLMLSFGLGSWMFQQFTSPYLLALIFPIYLNEMQRGSNKKKEGGT